MGLLAAFLVLISGIAMAQTKVDSPVPGVINIKFKQEALQRNRQNLSPQEIDEPELRALLSRYGFDRGEKIFRHFETSDTLATSRITGEPVILLDLSRWYTIWVADTVNTLHFAEQLMELPGVEAASPEFLMYPQQIFPNDPRFQSNHQWGLYNWTNPGKDIHAPQAWEINTGRSDVIIAVIDGGVDYTHSDLDPGNRSRIIQGYDVADNDSNPMDDIPSQYGFANHGTAVAGIIGAITNNNQQVAGVMWDAKIMPVKVAYTSSPWWDPFGWSMGGAPHSKVAAGVDWARQNGANIINLSLGGQGVSGNWYSTFINNPVTQATYNAYLSGVLVVAAMGNDDNQIVNYPAGFPWTMAVGASNQNDQRVTGVGWGSNTGSHIDVVAPGISYYSTYRNNQENSFGGTSAATPVVSGVAGLILSQSRDLDLNLTHDDIRNVIRVTADDKGSAGFDNEYGYGRVNAYEALKLISPPNVVEHGTTYGGNSTLFWNNHTHTFYRGMGTLATGVYHGVRTYKITGFASFSNSYEEPPVVWIRDHTTKGWSAANPNTEVPWVNITSVTNTGFYYETFVYWIGTNSAGQSINAYYPASPSNARIDYTAIGISSGTVTPPPPAPTLQGTVVWGAPNMSWNAVTGAASYRIHRTSTHPSVSNTTFTTTSTSYVDSLPFPVEVSCQIVFEHLTYTVQGVNSSDVAGSHSNPIMFNEEGAGNCLTKSAPAEEPPVTAIPEHFVLHNNYPNPFNPSTVIGYDLPVGSKVHISVYDVLGRRVALLVDSEIVAGSYQVNFSAGELISGIYIVRMDASGIDGQRYFSTVKMTLMK